LVLLAWLVAFVGLLMPSPVLAGGLELERPGQREFVVDHAELLDEAAEREIERLAAALLDEHATPIVVVTIESMAAHGGANMSIETFARILFDQWGVGHPTVNGSEWDTGILLLISKQDRKARIELGAGWGRSKDAEAERIMQSTIVPAFAAGDYSQGTVRGVVALAAMARSKPVPESRRVPSWLIELAVVTLAALLLVGIVTSLVRSGKSGWGWALLSLVAGVLAAILWGLVLDRFRRRRSKRCEPRGSFGGGRSGGGGATGSW
jgi:uncharacterized protein